MKVLNYTFKSTLEFFQMAEALASHSQRREEGGRWTGGLSFKESMELPKVGWNPEKLAAGTNKLLLRGKKTKISLKKDVRGGVLLVDNYSTGNPMAFKRKVRSKQATKFQFRFQLDAANAVYAVSSNKAFTCDASDNFTLKNQPAPRGSVLAKEGSPRRASFTSVISPLMGM